MVGEYPGQTLHVNQRHYDAFCFHLAVQVDVLEEPLELLDRGHAGPALVLRAPPSSA